MQTKHLGDETLDQLLGQKIQTERAVLTDILHLLKEVDRRRLYAKYSYSSLLEYACKRHGYSEDQAVRRITAARLLKDLPEIEEKIESGALTLTNLCKAQAVFRAEKKAACERTQVQKLEFLSKIENVSRREAEKTLELEARVELPKKYRELSLDQFTEDVKAKLKRLMDVLAHTECGSDVNALVGKLADIGLEKLDPIKKAARAESREKRAEQADVREKKARAVKSKVVSPGSDGAINNDAPVPAPARVNYPHVIKASIVRHAREHIDAKTRTALFKRDNYKCTRCHSPRALEVDHIVPFAKRGKTELNNLRLLCRSCNQRHAIESYGLSKMNRFLKEPSTLYITA